MPFKNYLNVEGFEINIREVLQELIVNYAPNGKSDHGNVIIMGNEKTGKTTLVKHEVEKTEFKNALKKFGSANTAL